MIVVMISAQHCTAQHCTARRGTARHGTARQGCFYSYIQAARVLNGRTFRTAVSKALEASKRSGRLGAKCYTPEITNVDVHSEMSLKVRWTMPLNIHLARENIREHTTEKCSSVGKYH